MQYVHKIFTISSLNGQLSLDRLKINQKSYYNLLYSAFWGLSTESQPQNPKFRNNPENIHPGISDHDQQLAYSAMLYASFVVKLSYHSHLHLLFHFVFLYKGSYTPDHFIWNLINKPSASLIYLIWNDHECTILFIIWPFKCDFISFKVCWFQWKFALLTRKSSWRYLFPSKMFFLFLFLFWLLLLYSPRPLVCRGSGRTIPLSHLTNYNFFFL